MAFLPIKHSLKRPVLHKSKLLLKLNPFIEKESVYSLNKCTVAAVHQISFLLYFMSVYYEHYCNCNNYYVP